MAIWFINNAPYNSHTEILFKSSSILPLSYVADPFRIQFMHQFFITIYQLRFWIAGQSMLIEEMDKKALLSAMKKTFMFLSLI